jgi:hypothetical protein
MSIETFVEQKIEKQNFDGQRKAHNRNADNVARKVLGALNAENETKNGGLLDGKHALRTPFFKVEVGGKTQNVAVKGVHDSMDESGFNMGTELVVKADGEKHPYAFMGHSQRIQYYDEHDFNLSRDDLLARDNEVVQIIESVGQVAQEKYGIQV